MSGRVPGEVIAALGRLNAHARGQGGFGTEGRAIYAYKTFVALLAIEAGEARVRFVRWMGPCGGCSGTGRWDSWFEDRAERCGRCSGNGTEALRFTETILPGGQVWHHPWESELHPGFDLAAVVPGFASSADAVFEGAGDWSPHAPAERLPLADMLPLLNRAEAWVEEEPCRPRNAPKWWLAEAAKRMLHQQSHPRTIGAPSHAYAIDLGEAPGGCSVCGAEAEHRLGRITPLFHWTVRACDAHRRPFPDGPPPASLMTPPVAEWLARHERVVEFDW